MAPVEFLRSERGLTVHLEGERLVELPFGRQRECHGLSEDVRLAEQQQRGSARDAGQVCHPDCAKRKTA